MAFVKKIVQDEIGKMGEFKKTRILGRLSDALTSRDFKVDSFAVDASLLVLGTFLLRNCTAYKQLALTV